jgi:hypothetical protein
MLSRQKDPRIEIPRLLLLARNQKRPCLLGIPGMCRTPGYDTDTNCCACHGNSEEYGKGRGNKAHDFFSVWGCSWCHTWLDSSYSASGEDRARAFREALDRQIILWGTLVTNPSTRPKDRDPITLALDHLIDRGYAAPDPTYYALPTYAWKHTS